MRSGLLNGFGTVVIFLVFLVTATAQAKTGWTGADLHVRMYDLTGQGDDQRRVALATATAVMTTAGVRIAWTLCAPAGSSEIGCSAPRRDTERVVRAMKTSPGWRRQEGMALGDSVVDRGSRSGVLATVHADRVSWMASRAGIDQAVLLGLAIAHELGHLLLGTSHTSAGIMRRNWTLNELRWPRPGDWQFTKEQVAALTSGWDFRASEVDAQRPISTRRGL